jgi:F-type H+-transporting ATPase subunit b
VTDLLTIMAAAPGEEAEGIAALGIDPLAIGAQAVTFLVLFWVVKKFALEGIVRSLEDRRKTIDKGVRLGVKMEAEQAKLEQTIDAKLQEARKQADAIIAGANKESGAIIRAAEARAAEKVDGMINDAHARIADDIANAKKDLQKEVVGLVAEATEAIIGEKMTSEKDEAFIKRMLEGVK